MTRDVPALFANKPASAAAYLALLDALDALGEYTIEEKKTSLHVTAGKAAFLGVHPRKEGLRLNIVLARQLEGPRITKVEKPSAKVFHNELDVRASGDFDAQLRDWLREARKRSLG